MESEGIVIRIKTPVGDMDSSVDSPSHLNFNDLLAAIKDVMPEATVTAFEYEDEVGDRITVRSDEELKAMLSYYCNTVMEQRINGLLPEPLQIFPRAGKTPGIRNIHGLKVCASMIVSAELGMDWLCCVPLIEKSIEVKTLCLSINEHDLQYQEQLGHGNGGTVYKAYHLLGKRIVAVKVIPLDITVELQKQIMSELEILYKCDSPYIIKFYSAFFVENRISICTEFMDGGSLDVYWRIPEHVLGRIAVAVVKGLTYLWSLKILHRDVKPSNMLVNTRGQIKLCDFGVSTQVCFNLFPVTIFAHPERISGEQYGIHSDVWSLGISFMEVVGMGSNLFFFYPPLLQPLQLLQCIVDEDPPVLPIGQFSEKFVHFITQCMRKQPKERPAPNNLMDHPFIMQYNDGNTEVVSMWVCRSLEERKSQQAQRLM
uniref:mitogen-activated protein kinase kinase n=1 Tax=Sinocyclocheilus rhinocerous TaxID=307959 RepID=A0A673KAK1_9TELE